MFGNLVATRSVMSSLSLKSTGAATIILQTPAKGNAIYLRLEADATKNEYQLLYSYDAKKFTTLGDKFPMEFGHWKGVRIGLYCYNVKENAGQVSFDDFVYQHDGPR